MNQAINLSQQKADLSKYRDLAFEVSCHLDQISAFMLQASCIEEYEDETKARCTAQAISKTSLIIFNKALLALDEMEDLFKSKELVEFRNTFTFVEGAVSAISESNITSKHQCNYFSGLFHVLKEMEKDISEVDLAAEEAIKKELNNAN
jgi:hypothetical protein